MPFPQAITSCASDSNMTGAASARARPEPCSWMASKSLKGELIRRPLFASRSMKVSMSAKTRELPSSRDMRIKCRSRSPGHSRSSLCCFNPKSSPRKTSRALREQEVKACTALQKYRQRGHLRCAARTRSVVRLSQPEPWSPIRPSLVRPAVRHQSVNVRSLRAPREGGAFQWVQAPPGERSSRKQPEQSWR